VRQVTTRQGELTAPPEALDSDLVLFVTLDGGQEVILHLEFQGSGSKKPMPLRMLDYQVRLALAYRGLPTLSVVWYLGGAGTRDPGSHQRIDPAGQVYLAWRYQVIRLWQLDAEDLLALQRPALLALIGQTRIRDPESTLTEAVRQLVQGTMGETQERLLAELLLLCSDEELAAMAEQIITRDYGLPETPMMRKLREEGREEGREEERLAVVLRQLTRRCGPLSPEVTAQVQQLAAPHLLDLTEALLDFTGAEDLRRWLARAR
jgi:predicted transposase YdaD